MFNKSKVIILHRFRTQDGYSKRDAAEGAGAGAGEFFSLLILDFRTNKTVKKKQKFMQQKKSRITTV